MVNRVDSGRREALLNVLNGQPALQFVCACVVADCTGAVLAAVLFQSFRPHLKWYSSTATLYRSRSCTTSWFVHRNKTVSNRHDRWSGVEQMDQWCGWTWRRACGSIRASEQGCLLGEMHPNILVIAALGIIASLTPTVLGKLLCQVRSSIDERVRDIAAQPVPSGTNMHRPVHLLAHPAHPATPNLKAPTCHPAGACQPTWLPSSTKALLSSLLAASHSRAARSSNCFCTVSHIGWFVGLPVGRSVCRLGGF